MCCCRRNRPFWQWTGHQDWRLNRNGHFPHALVPAGSQAVSVIRSRESLAASSGWCGCQQWVVWLPVILQHQVQLHACLALWWLMTTCGITAQQPDRETSAVGRGCHLHCSSHLLVLPSDSVWCCLCRAPDATVHVDCQASPQAGWPVIRWDGDERHTASKCHGIHMEWHDCLKLLPSVLCLPVVAHASF